MERVRITAYIVNSFPIWGCLIYAPLLKWLAGPTYTTAPNQNAMVMLFLGYMAWLVATGFIVLITTFIAKKPREQIFLSGLISWSFGYFICFEMLR